MAALAGHSLAAVHQSKTGMGILRKFRKDVRMAGLAGICADKIGGIHRAGLLVRVGLLLIAACSAHPYGVPESGHQHEDRHVEEHPSHLSLPDAGSKQPYVSDDQLSTF